MWQFLLHYGKDLLVLVFVAGSVWFIKTQAKRTLTAVVNILIHDAEARFQGSKLGPDKKAWVCNMLEEANIKITQGISNLIDWLVVIMNAREAEAQDQVTQNTSDAIDKITGGLPCPTNKD